MTLFLSAPSLRFPGVKQRTQAKIKQRQKDKKETGSSSKKKIVYKQIENRRKEGRKEERLINNRAKMCMHVQHVRPFILFDLKLFILGNNIADEREYLL